MTNKDKFLRDGVDSEKFIMQFAKFLIERKVRYNDEAVSTMRYELTNFFNEQVKPTLTEDERVILRNIPVQEKYIMRDEKSQLWTGRNPIYRLEQFEHLFQFIKERRRIRDS